MTRAELTTVRRLWIEIIQQEEYLIGLRGLLWSMERSLKAGRSNVTGRKVERMVLKILDEEERLQWLYERLDGAKKRLRAQIEDEVEDMTLRRLLILRYVERQTWTQISEGLDKSRREIYRMHKKFASQLDAH
ncbi:MAG: hypothetical protein IJP42_09985 [Selenomonadaceae bacterium]|nr:hypothetical protein [Selenomonadaceae bacterium]MBR0060471.1 hypothetical protein [Selenomonadaceae bacterium]